jgi:PHD/YefM family antitoxin component YafN of YafNO toxin-antitoxin module
MSDNLHIRTCDVAIAAQTLAQLHEYITTQDARVELTRAGSDERCVLVSKRDLDALERAVVILSNTEDMRTVSEKLAQLAAAAVAGDYIAA